MTHHRSRHHGHSGAVHKHAHHAARHVHKHAAHHHAHKAHHAHHHAHLTNPITWVGKEVVHPIWKDVVRPTVGAVTQIPTQAFNTVDHGIHAFETPSTIFVVAGIAAIMFLARK